MAGYGQHKRKDYTGQTFGFLTALKDIGSTGRKRLWQARCVCGKIVKRDTSDLVRGCSCGCKNSELLSKARTTHGMSLHPTYAVWRSMHDRCRLPSHQSWHNYGGRGIRVECKSWDAFENFWNDMKAGYRPGLTIERRDNSKGYFPENCYWGTRIEQGRNRRSNRVVQTRWGQMTLAEAAERSGIGLTTLLYRLNHGVPLKLLFTKPDVRNRFTTF
jgi:hypothetical protein